MNLPKSVQPKHGRDTTARLLSEQLARQTGRREQTEGERVRLERRHRAATREILELERETARLENRAAQLKTEETQILDKMWESYELTPTPAAEIAKPIENLGETRGRVQELRVKMRALGNVNLDAVDEFQRVQERYSFLREQKDDLETAQTDLRKGHRAADRQHEGDFRVRVRQAECVLPRYLPRDLRRRTCRTAACRYPRIS